MEIRARIATVLILLLMAGCSRSTVNISSDRTAKAADAAAPQPTPPQASPKTNAPRTLKLKLTLDSPGDLKVVQGQSVVKDQILSDRSSARERLSLQRQILLLKLEQLKQLPSRTASASSPEISYAEERAKIAQAKLEVDQAQKAIAQFLANSPWTEEALQIHRSEREKLAQLEAGLQQKQANLILATAQLQAAREKHREETQRQQQPQQQDKPLEQAQTVTQLNSIEGELTRLGVVRSPYNGTVKKIKWVGQTDAELLAELTITVDSKAVTEKDSATAQIPVTTKPKTVKSSAPLVALATKPETTKSAAKLKPNRRETQTPITNNQTPITNNRGQGFQPTWQVISVYDGDTLKVRQGQKVERIRMACLDAPELAQPLGKESRDRLKSIIQQNGDRVTLKIVDTDRYGRKIAEVFTGDKLLQAEQTRNGMAYVYNHYLNNCPDAAMVKQAEAIAQASKVGVWSGSYQKPWEYRRTQRSIQPSATPQPKKCCSF